MGSFEIRNHLCNSENVLKTLGEKPVELSKNMNLRQERHQEKILGMCTETDCYCVKEYVTLQYKKVDSCVLSGQRRPTKFEILRTLISIYDPSWLNLTRPHMRKNVAAKRLEN